MSTILYVDHIDKNGGEQTGRVITLDKINKILQQIEADMDMITDELTVMNNVQHVQRAGRFLIWTKIMLDAPEYKYQMVIADTKGDEISGGAFVASVIPSLRPLAAKLFSDLRSISEEEKTKFEMAVGNIS